jgi:hypothetical protein
MLLITEHILGNSCSRRSITNSLHSLAVQHEHKLEVFLQEAYANEWFLILIIDDYTQQSIHTADQLPQNHQAQTTCAP